MRIGYASDIHQLGENRKLILGGVEIPHYFGLLGHSDADVVIHALGEAILGALSLGDLGTYFPDTDKKYQNIDSKIILKEIDKMMHKYGYKLGNADISISLEKPKLRPYIDKMRYVLANVLQVDVSQISIKAGTNEGLGDVGHEKACVATAVVLLEREDK